MDYNKWTIYR